MAGTPVPPGGPIGAQPGQAACARHPDRATGLLCARCERPACPDCLREAAVGFQCVDCVTEGARTTRQARTVEGATHASTGRRLLVVPVLIVVNLALFALTAYLGGGVTDRDVFQSDVTQEGALVPYFVALGEWWRLVTSGFLHLGVTHIGLNMASLYILGRDLEPVLGRARFLAVYLLSLLGGSASVYLFEEVVSPTAGASGAIYGLMGSLLVVLLRRRLNATPVLAIIAINVFLSFSLPNISILGHLGGIAVGAAVTAALVYAPRGPQRARWQAGSVVAFAVALVVLTVVRTAVLVG